VSAERGEDGLEFVSVILVGVACQVACAGVGSGLIGWYGEHTLARAERIERLKEQFF
jgi:hypothetical protein